MTSTPQAWMPTQLENLARAKLFEAIRDQRIEAAASAARELYRLLQQHGRLAANRRMP